MKKYFALSVLSILAASMLLLVSCKKDENKVQVESIKFKEQNVSIVEGDSQKLEYEVLPSNVDDVILKWESSDAAIVAVDGNGRITGMKVGNATITVSDAVSAVKAECNVTVTSKVVNVSSITLNKTELELFTEEEFQFEATILPADATNKKVTWKVADGEIANVSAGGLLTAMKSGETTLTATTEDSGKQATCKVVVKEKVIPVEMIKLDKNVLTLTEGTSEQLTAEIFPKDATNKNILWSVSDETVATVTDGLVHALKAGEVTVTVTTEDGNKTDNCVITIDAKVVEYIDEYGINHGPGIEINGTVWAPVNCGYHAEDYQYGKYYQWGRKEGLGISGNVYKFYQKIREHKDKTYPSIDDNTIKEALAYGEIPDDEVFYKSTETDGGSWMQSNDGTAAFDNKTIWNDLSDVGSPHENNIGVGNPCPEGWEIPTQKQFQSLMGTETRFPQDEVNGQTGCWMSGLKSLEEAGDNKVFLIFGGELGHNTGMASEYKIGQIGYYWCAEPGVSVSAANDVIFTKNISLAGGYSVRCVKSE